MKLRARGKTPSLTENEIVRRLRKLYAADSPFLKKGIGDDAAVIHPKGAEEDWVVTTDMLLEDIDFRRSWTTPRQLGHKALAINLSDLAAMGARPRFHTVALALPVDTAAKWIDEFFAGMTLLGDACGAILIGGDLSSSNQGIQITITALGETLRERAVYRSGGRAGDLLYVTGSLGKSAAGLALLQHGCLRGRSGPQREALNSHRAPEPRSNEGLWLTQQGFASAMIDLSDGLSTDLPRLCEASDLGAEIYTSYLPLFVESAAWGCNPEHLALNGGEDYELLFSVPQRLVRRLKETYPPELVPLSQIGKLVEKRGVVWMTRPGDQPRPLPEGGYDHFRR